MKKNLIGRKVFLVKDVYMDKGTKYTIVSIKDYDEANDWCQHYVLKDELGMPLEVREVDCVIAPDYSLDTIRMIDNFLSENELWADVYSNGQGSSIINVYISWGDWKHSHLWCRQLMNYLGYKQVSEEVTEDDGSDCYSAIHKYILA